MDDGEETFGESGTIRMERFKDVFFKKYFPRSVCRQKEFEFI